MPAARRSCARAASVRYSASSGSRAPTTARVAPAAPRGRPHSAPLGLPRADDGQGRCLQFADFAGIAAGQGDGPAIEAGDEEAGDDHHPELDEPLPRVPLVVGVAAPRRHQVGRGDIGNAVSPLRQQLGQATAHVVLVEVEQHHRRDDLGARHDVVRRQDSTAERRGHRDRTCVGKRGRPACAGCDDHAGKPNSSTCSGESRLSK